MKQTLRLKRGLYVHFDSYKRPFLYHLRPKASRLTTVFAVGTFILCLGYGTLAPRLLDDAPAYQPAAQAQGRFEPLP